MWSRMIFLSGEGRRYVLLEDIILYFCDELFENYTVEEKAVLCIQEVLISIQMMRFMNQQMIIVHI